MTAELKPPVLSRAYYKESCMRFMETPKEMVMGILSENSEFSVEPEQRDAWVGQIEILQQALVGIRGMVYLEFNIPRIGSRIDAVVISGSVVFVIEFKVGESEYKRDDINQVWDYALDLKNFHEPSHAVPILPVLVATHAHSSDGRLTNPFRDGVYPPVRCNASGICQILQMGINAIRGNEINGEAWGLGRYQPTPTIIEAARTLYAKHSVEEIARHDAGARNLKITSHRIEDLIDEARKKERKTICFVTGVPGSGKTLVGLNVATKRRDANKPAHAVFLSGNGPLVAVLQEALVRDEVERLRAQNQRQRKGQVRQKVKAFIQNVHHFRDDGLRDPSPPVDHVVIFDEAQRAWNLEKTRDFMQRKKKRAGFTQSEPEFLISYLDRHTDWAMVVCLVGGGQEINTGEAGISAWLDAVRDHFPNWHVYVSPDLNDSEFDAARSLQSLQARQNVYRDKNLHLAISMRSFRAENVSAFVKAVLDCEIENAQTALKQMKDRYPMVLTRDIAAAKKWIRTHARGSERFGLVASSEAQRLKPHAIDVRVEIDPIHWFLNDADDTRSSYYLEDAATEFQVQGLELDWVCVTWDGDLRYHEKGWLYHSFRGDRWTIIHKTERKAYLKNAYRVLLTRARQGMVIFVPYGDSDDPTRDPKYYDSTFEYLLEIGIPTIESDSRKSIVKTGETYKS